MPDQRISELIEKTTLADTDLMPMVDIEATPDETKKITGANVKAQVLAGHKDLTTGVHGVGASTVCSEAIADSKITTHKGDASAHHTKTGDNEVYGLVAAGIAADKPVAGIAGRWYFSIDTLILSRDNGNAWIEMARGETAIRLAQLSEKSHISLTDITANQHHNQSHDHSLAADGSPIAVAGVPNLDASKITSGRFGMPRMPDGTSGLVLTAQGTGVDPVYAAGEAGEDSYARILAWLGV